uniref:Major capsid protein n=1 Tax=Dulem virus 221 TaxID=3145698 RepID=A0AAU8B330_9VIRU
MLDFMANVLEIKNLKNKVSRNGFDLSERRAFTAKVGELVPCFVMEILPGDHVSLNPSHFTRTMPVNTAAYTQLREYVHFYFVPYRLLHSGADVFFSDNKENPTRASSINSPKASQPIVPYLTAKSILDRLMTYQTKSAVDAVGYEAFRTSIKLLEYLGYGDYTRFSDHELSVGLSSTENIRLNPFALLAYQKIYQDHFRNQSWEKSSPHTCNIDYLPFGAQVPLGDAKVELNSVVSDMLTMRYCDYNKDYFFGLVPEAQYGDYVLVDPVVKPGALVDEVGEVLQVGQPIHVVDLSRGIQKMFPGASVLALRKAEALQKYREIRNSGDKDYKTFLEKIFNVSVSNDRSDLSLFLGGYNSDIAINEVVNSDLSNSPATVAGKGVSSSGASNIEFDAKENGVIIGIYTCRPTIDYAINAPLKTNLRIQYEDYANPVFDRVGMETVHLDEIMMPFISTSYYSASRDVCRAPVGYVPRYSSYKTNYDKVLGAFRRTLSAWVSPVTSEAIYRDMVGTTGPTDTLKSEWSKNPIESGRRVALSYRSFKVRPNVVDSIFVQQADGSIESDQLLINMSVACPMVRNLDYDGLPY